jgi:Holliday junction DNA helicase RuvA
VIGRLRGTIVGRDASEVVIECGGVGYEVTCSAFTRAALPAEGVEVILLVFTHAQENKIALYGFFTAAERGLFDHLITVKNVGPSSAMSILSGGHDPRSIAELIANEDIAGLTRIKGVGKKTAELLVVELREKCELMLLSWTADGELRPGARPAGAFSSTGRARRHPMLEEVAAALVGMGWRPAEADQAVGELPVDGDSTLESLLRQALRAMPR